MSYRFGLSPSDVVQDARGNVLNTTLTLYVLEADADARTNPLVSVPVSSGNWTYTHATYKSLWARTATSDPFPVVSIDAQIASLGTAVSITDNGDGGFTLSGSKLAGWQWVKDTFVSIANAVALATTNPLASGTAYAGTALTASRGDHVHPIPPAKPTSIGFTSGAIMPMHPNSGSLGTSLNRAVFAPIYITTPSRAPLVCSNIGVKVTTAAGAGGTIRFALWGSNADGSINMSNKVFESGDIPSTTTGLKNFAYTTPIPEGLYWRAAVMHTATCQLQQDSHGFLLPAGGGGGNTDDKMYLDGVTGAFGSTPPNIGGDGTPGFYFTIA